jgi:hypothetical protein
MSAAFETENPIGVTVATELMFHKPVGTGKMVAAEAELAIEDNLVLGAVEEAGGSRRCVVSYLAVSGIYGAGIGDDGSRFPPLREDGSRRERVCTREVGLKDGYRTSAVASEDDLLRVDTQLAAVGDQPGESRAAVLGGIAYGGVEISEDLVPLEVVGIHLAEAETVVDGYGGEAARGEELAARDGGGVVAGTYDEATAEDVNHTGVIGTGIVRTIDVELECRVRPLYIDVGFLGYEWGSSKEEECEE